jgi:hypothetical protein
VTERPDCATTCVLVLFTPQPPVGFTSSVIATLAPANPRRRWRTPLLWAASVTAATGLVAASSVLADGRDREPATDYRHSVAVATPVIFVQQP